MTDVLVIEWYHLPVQMEGEGTYTYSKSTDIYSGQWVAGLKHGKGTYEFGSDSSFMAGEWVNGQITVGQWVLKGAAVYDGAFKLGRPIGPGKFSFEGGLVQSGTYTEVKKSGEEEEEPAEGEVRLPNVAWVGTSIVSF
jgi:hypothetical protein